MKKNLTALLLIAVLLFVFTFSLLFTETYAQPNQKKIEVGEEITYVVKYLAFEIGEIKLIVQKEQVVLHDWLAAAKVAKKMGDNYLSITEFLAYVQVVQEMKKHQKNTL